MKIPTKNSSCSQSISDDLLSLNINSNTQSSTSNSSKLPKHVTFNDEVSKAKYKPNREVFNITKLASRQQKKLKILDRKDSLNFNERTYIGLRHARRFHSWDSSATESSDDD